jgi:hypothetical protein
MRRANTRWCVAAMKHLHTVWYGAIRQFPRDPMGECIPSTGPKPTISITVAIPRPQPAPIVVGLLDPGPEPLGQRTLFASASTRATTESASIRWLRRIGRSAALTAILRTHRRVPPVGVTLPAVSQTARGPLIGEILP